MNVAIVGCGLIGHKRAEALGEHRLVACADVSIERAESLANIYPDCVANTEVHSAIDRSDVDAVIVATPHDALASTAVMAAEASKHVLVEKPAARRAAELRPLIEAVDRGGVVAKVGFNHRFHPTFQRARKIVDDGGVGPLLYVRARYGHGGRPGYEHEWRADPAISGGGELLDQGSHLIDLARWFLGDFSDVRGHLATYFWQMPVEDNAFLLLETSRGQVAWLHASWTEWKNLFSFEIFGSHGKLQIDGLGGSYGPERLTHFRMLPELGPPETTSWEYTGSDQSWADEFAYFADCVATGQPPEGNLQDALAVLETIDQLYSVGPVR